MTDFLTMDLDRITTVIYQKVKPGRRQGYEEWVKGIATAAKQFPGHQGITILRPHEGSNSEYIIVFQFESATNLEKWLNSPTRKEWIERSLPFVDRPPTVESLTGWETWFMLPHQPTLTPPPRSKMAILTGISVFTLVNLYSWLLAGLLGGLPPLLRSLIVIILVVISLTYVIMPRLTQLLQRWLFA